MFVSIGNVRVLSLRTECQTLADEASSLASGFKHHARVRPPSAGG